MQPDFVFSHDPGSARSVPVTQLDVTRAAVGNGIKVTVGAASAASAAMPATTRAVRVVATVDCWVNISADPTAAADTSFYLPAGAVEYFAAVPGDKVAALQASSGGFLYLRPVN